MLMNTANPSAAYRSAGIEAEVLGTSPHGLITMLFDGALLSIKLAQSYMAESKTVEKAEAINKAINIIGSGLRAALNIKEGGELANNLDQLYEYIIMQLLKANMTNEMALLDEAYHLLNQLADAWKEVGHAQSVDGTA